MWWFKRLKAILTFSGYRLPRALIARGLCASNEVLNKQSTTNDVEKYSKTLSVMYTQKYMHGAYRLTVMFRAFSFSSLLSSPCALKYR